MLLNSSHLLAELAARCVVGMRGEERDRVVAPVVAQPLLLQHRVVQELVHRHQLDRGDADALQVVDHRGVPDRGVGAAQLLRDVGVQLGEALDVRFVDDALGVRDLGGAVTGPVEERVHDDAEQHARGGVVVVALVGIAELVREHRLAPPDVVAGRLRVRIEQQLVRVAAQTLVGIPRPVDAVAVPLTRLHLGQVDVPDVAVHLGQLDARLDAGVVEQAQLDLLGHLAEEREVGAGAVEGRARAGRRCRARPACASFAVGA